LGKKKSCREAQRTDYAEEEQRIVIWRTAMEEKVLKYIKPLSSFVVVTISAENH
jgi:hypothetical protein